MIETLEVLGMLKHQFTHWLTYLIFTINISCLNKLLKVNFMLCKLHFILSHHSYLKQYWLARNDYILRYKLATVWLNVVRLKSNLHQHEVVSDLLLCRNCFLHCWLHVFQAWKDICESKLPTKATNCLRAWHTKGKIFRHFWMNSILHVPVERLNDGGLLLVWWWSVSIRYLIMDPWVWVRVKWKEIILDLKLSNVCIESLNQFG